MKKAILILLAGLGTQNAMAGQVYCTASLESERGSGVYNKLVFHEAVDLKTSLTRFISKDGTVITPSTPAEYQKIKTGDKVVAVTFNEESRPQLFIGVVVKSSDKNLSFRSKAHASTLNSTDVFLLANDVAVTCQEQK